jgi:hypothetical protein
MIYKLSSNSSGKIFSFQNIFSRKFNISPGIFYFIAYGSASGAADHRRSDPVRSKMTGSANTGTGIGTGMWYFHVVKPLRDFSEGCQCPLTPIKRLPAVVS